MFEDPVHMLTDPSATLFQLRSLGVGAVRMLVQWNLIAPDPAASAAPAGFQAGDPAAYPASNWAPYDAAVRAAQADGIELDFLLTGPAPLWAAAPGAPPSDTTPGAWEPSASAYGQFVQAVATRYSGIYKPPGAATALPRVHFWEIWNEPNWGPSLAPQVEIRPLRVVSAPEYRGLLNSAWSALQRTGHGHDTILIGSLSPRGTLRPPTSDLVAELDISGPLSFTRALYCVDSSFHPLRGPAASTVGCPTTDAGSHRFRVANPGLFEASGYAIHPYPIDLPPTQADASGPDSVQFSQIPHLTTALDKAQGAYGSDGRMQIYNTEFGYITHPPNAGTEYPSPSTAALWLNWAEYLTWRNPRLASTMQYQLYDPPPGPSALFGPGGFATGLLSSTGVPKATYYAYRMPIWLPHSSTQAGHSLTVWGCVRPAHFASLDKGGAPQFVQIQFRPGAQGTFETLRTVRITDIRGYFETPVKFPATGQVRLAWTYPSKDVGFPAPLQGRTVHSRLTSVTVR